MGTLQRHPLWGDEPQGSVAPPLAFGRYNHGDSDDSLLKMLYLAMMDITKKWTGRRQDWSLIHAQMAIYFAGRMPE